MTSYEFREFSKAEAFLDFLQIRNWITEIEWSSGWAFRGHGSDQWGLIPSALRFTEKGKRKSDSQKVMQVLRAKCKKEFPVKAIVEAISECLDSWNTPRHVTEGWSKEEFLKFSGKPALREKPLMNLLTLPINLAFRFQHLPHDLKLGRHSLTGVLAIWQHSLLIEKIIEFLHTHCLQYIAY